MFSSKLLMDSFTYKTMKLLSCYQQRTEKIIKSNIAVLFSFHLAAVLIETDANVEPISLHFLDKL